MFQSPLQGSMHGSNGGSGSGGNGTPNVFGDENRNRVDIHCDDCDGQPLRLLRWCKTCSSAICDACVLDRHPGHEIGCYQKASREAKTEFENLQVQVRKEMESLSIKRQSALQFQKEIKQKLDATINKIQKRADEASEMAETMKGQLDELEKLAKTPLNGKTIFDRNHATESSRTLAEKLSKRHEIIERQLKMAMRVAIEEVYGGSGESVAV